MIRAVFVPDGEDSPAEFLFHFDQLRIRATRDPATGQITCDGAGTNFGGDIFAEWHPDEDQGSDEGDGANGQGGNGIGSSEMATSRGHAFGGDRSGTLAMANDANSARGGQRLTGTPADADLARGGDEPLASAKRYVGNPATAAPKPNPGSDKGPPNFKRFFDTLKQPVGDLAKELGVPEDYLLRHFAWESGYLNDHNFALNNPFGFTAAGKNNLAFASIADAVAAYKDRYGQQIRGATSAKDFADRIQGKLNGKPLPGWHKYNSIDPKYESHVQELIRSVSVHEAEWEKQKEQAR